MQRPKVGGFTSVVSGQRLGRHVPRATNRRAKIEVIRSYKEDNWGDKFSSVLKSVKRGLERVKLMNLHC
jgi:hypothetical protein